MYPFGEPQNVQLCSATLQSEPETLSTLSTLGTLSTLREVSGFRVGAGLLPISEYMCLSVFPSQHFTHKTLHHLNERASVQKALTASQDGQGLIASTGQVEMLF